jgi:hypothetical protein
MLARFCFALPIQAVRFFVGAEIGGTIGWRVAHLRYYFCGYKGPTGVKLCIMKREEMNLT